MAKFYYIQTYGCQMNVHDAEKIAGMLTARGYEPCDDVKKANVVALITCCVRETAESKVFGHLGRLKKIKEDRGDMIIAVCGCMTQQPSVAEKMKKICPHVDIIIGTHNLYMLGEYIDEYDRTKTRRVEVWEKELKTEEDTPVKRASGVNAWVNIMYGCNNFCSYCIVPYVRGRERSRDFDVIVSEVRELIEAGYKEVTLLGQNVNSYNYKGKTFIDLLRALDFSDKKYRLKFMTSHPKDFSEAIAKEIAESKCLSKYLHLPIQAGSDRVLELMNRRYTAQDYINKVEMLRSYVPNVGLSSDIMVGFPTETDDDFLDTLNVIRRVKYNSLFTFVYSRRSGTPADKMEQIPASVKQDRIKTLIAAQFDIGKQVAESYVGNTFEVLCSECSGGKGYGKAQNETAVTFDSDVDVTGEFVQVKITKTKNSNLFGEKV